MVNRNNSDNLLQQNFLWRLNLSIEGGMWEYIWNICIITHLLFTSVRKLVYAWKSALDTSLHPKVTNPWLLKLTKIQVAFSIVLKIFNAHLFLTIKSTCNIEAICCTFYPGVMKMFCIYYFWLGKVKCAPLFIFTKKSPSITFFIFSWKKAIIGIWLAPRVSEVWRMW